MTPGLYTLTLKVDDKPLPVGANEDGTRDDPAAVIEIHIAVTSINASMQVLQARRGDDAADVFEKAPGVPYGNWCDAAVVLDLGPALQYRWEEPIYRPDQGTFVSPFHLRIEEVDGHTADPSQTEKKLESLGGMALWEKYNSVEQSWTSSQASVSSYLGIVVPNGTALPQSGEQSERFRIRRRWNTAGAYAPVSDDHLWRHNGLHKLSAIQATQPWLPLTTDTTLLTQRAKVVFPNGHTNGQILTATAAPKEFDVQNVVFTRGEAHDKNANGVTVYNPDYFFFDPDSDDELRKHPKITFTIEDKGDPHQYKWEIRIRSTSSEDRLWTTFTRGILTQPGTKTVTIGQPATPDTQEGTLIYRGTYAFDIQIEEYENASNAPTGKLDSEVLKSPFLTIPEWIAAPGTDNDGLQGHNFYIDWDNQEDMHAKVSYWLEDSQGKNANKIGVDFFDSEWKLLAHKTGPLPGGGGLSPVVRVIHPDNELYAFQGGEIEGNYKTLFTAEDGHSFDYRDHQNRNMVAVNKYNPNLGIEWITGYRSGVSWYGCWIKAGKPLSFRAGLTTQVETALVPLKTSTNGDANHDLWTVPDFLFKQVAGSGNWTNPVTGLPYQNLVWGAINGAFFDDDHLSTSYAVAGEVGDTTAPAGWKGGGLPCSTSWPTGYDNPLKRWAFGINNNHITVERMTKPSFRGTYRASSTLKVDNPYGLSGVGRWFDDNGDIEVFPPKVLAGQDTSQYAPQYANHPDEPGGVHEHLLKSYARSLFVWSASQKHQFFIVSQQKLAGLGGGWDFDETSDFLTDQTMPTANTTYKYGSLAPWQGYGMRGYINGYTTPITLKSGGVNGNLAIPIGNGLNIGPVQDTIQLDGGSHSSVAWLWVKNKVPPALASGTLDDKISWLQQNEEWNEAHGEMFEGHNGNRTVIQAH